MTTIQQLPKHITQEQYNGFFESCYDEDFGYHDDGMLESLQEMIDLSLAIEKLSEAMGDKMYTDVSLEIEEWDSGFVCVSDDLVVQKLTGGFAYYKLSLAHMVYLVDLGAYSAKGIFDMLAGKRALGMIKRSKTVMVPGLGEMNRDFWENINDPNSGISHEPPKSQDDLSEIKDKAKKAGWNVVED